MAISNQVKLQVEAELALGKRVVDLSEQYDIPYATVSAWARGLNSKKESALIDELVTVDATTLQVVANQIKEVAPPAVARQVSKLVDSVIGLQQLEPKFLSMVENLLEKGQDLLDKEDLNVKDWVLISNAMGSLYSCIFNKSGVNVNVLNQTNVSNERLSMFKSSMKDS